MLIHYLVAREQVPNRTHQPNTLITTLPFCFWGSSSPSAVGVRKQRLAEGLQTPEKKIYQNKKEGHFLNQATGNGSQKPNYHPTAMNKILSTYWEEERQHHTEQSNTGIRQSVIILRLLIFSYTGCAALVNQKRLNFI